MALCDPVAVRERGEAFDELLEIYRASFPPEERIEAEKLLDPDGRIMLTLWRDRGLGCGMSFLLSGDDLCYLWYLAVKPELRGQGYGECILRRIFTFCGSRPLALHIEDPAQRDAGNPQIRQARAAFYQRLGMRRCGVNDFWRGIPFELMLRGGHLSPAALEAFFNSFDL